MQSLGHWGSVTHPRDGVFSRVPVWQDYCNTPAPAMCNATRKAHVGNPNIIRALCFSSPLLSQEHNLRGVTRERERERERGLIGNQLTKRRAAGWRTEDGGMGVW